MFKNKYKLSTIRKQEWLSKFEELVVKMDGRHRGKIEWDSGYHFINIGLSVEEAAERYVANRKEK